MVVNACLNGNADEEADEGALGQVRCILQHWVLLLKTMILMALITIMMTLVTAINYS